jgi:hypothetical protein
MTILRYVYTQFKLGSGPGSSSTRQSFGRDQSEFTLVALDEVATLKADAGL